MPGPTLDARRRTQLERLAARLGHAFGDLTLLDRALTHKSCANEEAALAGRHNEPLEFLGDAVLGLGVADLLHRHDPQGAEGPKSFARAALVSEHSLAQRARELGLPELLRLGRGEEKTGGRHKATLWADAFEAVLAALYLDGGLPAAQRFLAAVFGPEVRAAPGRTLRDHKSVLQEWLQGRGAAPPEYVVVAEEGPSHRRLFKVRCLLGGRAVSGGEGPSKKQAQQQAAQRALELLEAGAFPLPAESAPAERS